MVPPAVTGVHGQARFQTSRDGTELSYNVKVTRIEDVVGAHIHLGLPGENGTLVVYLFDDGWAPLGPYRGNLAAGTIAAEMLMGPLEGHPVSALTSEMEAGNAYVDVHTVGYSDGEIRRQIHAQ